MLEKRNSREKAQKAMRSTGGEPRRTVPPTSRDFLSNAKKPKYRVKTGDSRELPHVIFRPRFRSEIIHSRYLPANLSRVETFPGAACLTKFAVRHAPRQISRGLLGAVQSGSPPFAAPPDSWILAPGSYSGTPWTPRTPSFATSLPELRFSRHLLRCLLTD